MKLTWGTALVAALILQTGCATRATVDGHLVQQQWHGSLVGYMLVADNLQTSIPGTFVSGRCPKTTPIVRDGAWVTGPQAVCTPVIVTPAPPGREAYGYVFKVKIKSNAGIPYGESAVRIIVVGDKAECLARSGEHNVRVDGRVNEGNYRLSADPTERCVGPVYVREVGTTTGGQQTN